MKAWNSFIIGLGYLQLVSLIGVVAAYAVWSWESIRWRRTIAEAQRKAFLKEMERIKDLSDLDHLYRLK